MCSCAKQALFARTLLSADRVLLLLLLAAADQEKEADDREASSPGARTGARTGGRRATQDERIPRNNKRKEPLGLRSERNLCVCDCALLV